MVLIVRWLWSLVSDVVYLSVRLAWDYALAGYQYCWQHISTIRQDFRKNSSRPGAWLRGVWQAFDGRFEKESRWAFWRHCWRKKADAEAGPTGRTGTHHHNKDHGRLPSTADEAMSSLLNCKGKDAYSILGVSPDCSQEQIRKHYKKIAVLVHPDKNKQPGAEEAFKVLQRSFELIGEQETRKEYDQSLAEALNAEKAWSEINDLLTQLHTKISEAANTIRCSSCCLRHPRKPTGRAHFAARECSSCKVRHPAKEGDIWAETSCLGLRWKYLAMMEGNVYDITEWANCQKGALSHLQPNSHVVQYRIVLGSSSGGASSSQQHQQHPSGMQQDKESLGRSRKEPTVNEPNLDDFLNNIYAGQNQQAAGQAASGSRRRYRRN
uniref:Putative molecular chaperone dnaj superfamily n=1 Tax=Anopheles braziliensis TaxID=58242 RepID=A0A2M3ZLW7_9DIPT